MTSSQLVCQLYKNPNSLSHGVFGTNYKMSTMSARSWWSYGKIEDHEQFIGIRLHAAVFLAPATARNQDFMWGGANEAKADPDTEMYFLSSDPFI